MSTESHDTRPAFERHAEGMGYSITRDSRAGQTEGYWSSHTHLMWESWKAATAQQAAEVHRLKEHAVILAATAEEVERERCAKLCEDQDTGDASNWSMAVQECARLIRARQDGAGKKG